MVKRLILGALLAVYAGFVFWFVGAIDQVSNDQIQAYRELAKPSPIPEAIVRFDNVTPGLVVPSWAWTNDDRIWGYVAPAKAVDASYAPELTQLSVAHGNGWMYTDQIHPDADKALVKLFEEAEKAGFPLIVTSAYRSASDQDALYRQSQADYGDSWARQYVAKIGHSEHQLGLSVDLSSYSTSCQAAFANCHLGKDAASWLAKNAFNYSFILRYPSDKVAITGIAHEPWHFRYVGERMAKFVQQSGLTFDEISQKLITEKGSK